jgi:hypothetical protein
MKRYIVAIGSLLLLGLMACSSVRAEAVEVGSVTVTSGACAPPLPASYYCGSETTTNLMSDTDLDIEGNSVNGSAQAFGTVMISPGASFEYFTWESTGPDDSFFLYGVLGNTDFTVDGQTYTATSLDWTSPTWQPNSNGTYDIDVTVAPLSATPELSSLILFATGITLIGAITLASRRRRIAHLSSLSN